MRAGAGGGGGTVGFSDHLRDCVETLGGSAERELDFNEDDGQGTADFELVFNAPFSGHPARHDRLGGALDEEVKLRHYSV